ncbi:MAG TPA: hypothetical protein VLC71_12985 [Thermomonas sp.]|nr:hypothetical protein [Thermomonas sp.]
MTYASTTARMSNSQKKASVFFLVLVILAFANETFDWRLVGNYDWEAIVALTLFGLGGFTYAALSGRSPEQGAHSQA